MRLADSTYLRQIYLLYTFVCVLVDEHLTARREQYAASIDIAPIRVVEDLRTNYTPFFFITTWLDYGRSSQSRCQVVNSMCKMLIGKIYAQ